MIHRLMVIAFLVATGLWFGLAAVLYDSLWWFAFCLTSGGFVGWHAEKIVCFLEGKVK